MKTKTFLWGVTIIGLTVGFSSLAMGGQEKVRTSPEPSALPAQSALSLKKVRQAPKASVDTSLVRIVDDQLGLSSKISEPLYQPPRRGAPGGRVGGGTRGPSPGLPLLYALVPDHVAVTANEQPPLVWYLSKATALPLEFTVLEGSGVVPILEVPLSSPAEAGIHMLSLGEYDLKFEQGKTYQWFVSLIPDPARRSKDIIAGGLLEVMSLPENIAEAVRQATPQEATRILARAGFWYDAIGAISQEIQAHATDRDLHDLRAALLEQVDLNTVAQVDRQTGM
ncbi:MAG: DUF928 domain-containing protein [Nitrospirota bacterium]|nr:DUF928 domain-containing protein [Nitrospirota bacterium]